MNIIEETKRSIREEISRLLDGHDPGDPDISPIEYAVRVARLDVIVEVQEKTEEITAVEDLKPLVLALHDKVKQINPFDPALTEEQAAATSAKWGLYAELAGFINGLRKKIEH